MTENVECYSTIDFYKNNMHEKMNDVDKDVHNKSKINNKNEKRNADKSGRGFAFQRLRLIHLIFTEYKDRQDFNNISVKEEDMEDICFTINEKKQNLNDNSDHTTEINDDFEINNDIEIKYDNDKYISIEESVNKKILYQEKYGKMTESITITEKEMSGIMKVILSHYNNHNNIEALYFEVSHDINVFNDYYYPRMKLFRKLKEENIESAIKVLLCFTTHTKINEFNDKSNVDDHYNKICDWLLNQSIEELGNVFVIEMTNKINNLIYKIDCIEKKQISKNNNKEKSKDFSNEKNNDDDKETLKNQKSKLDYLQNWLKFVKYIKNLENLENIKNFVQKINIIEGKSYKDTLNEIHEKIKDTKEFKQFIKISDKYQVSKKYEDFHSECIYGLLNNEFIDNLFEDNKEIKLCDLFKKIVDKIKSCKNPNDIMILILDAYDQIIITDNNNNNNNLKIVEVIADLSIRNGENISYSAYTIYKLSNNYVLLAKIFNSIIIRIKYNVLLDKDLISFANRVYKGEILFTKKRKFKSLILLNESVTKYRKDNKLELKEKYIFNKTLQNSIKKRIKNKKNNKKLVIKANKNKVKLKSG